MSDPIDAQLAEILALALEREVAPGEELGREDETRWDSLKHLEIIFAVEDAFGVSFSADEIAAATCVADLRRKVLASNAA
jgi:acyl carrier protein